jgi:hypothetical protein
MARVTSAISCFTPFSAAWSFVACAFISKSDCAGRHLFSLLRLGGVPALDYLVMGGSGIMAIPKGSFPAVTSTTTLLVAVSITETVPEPEFVT